MREVGRSDHASTEQLSALLDDRAEPGERMFLATHVDQCPVCSNELADLRSVRSLLRALPVYPPPRSFTISIETARARRRFRRLIPLTRVLGTLAAVLCVVLFAVDAMRVGTDAASPIPDGAAGAFQITTAAKATSALAAPAKPAEAAKPAEPAQRIAAKPADAATKPAESGRAAAIAETKPAAPAAAPAPPRESIAAAANAPAAAAAPAAPAPAQTDVKSGGGAAPAVPAAARESATAPPVATAMAQSQPTVSSFAATQQVVVPTVASAATTVPAQSAGGAAADSAVVIQRPAAASTSPWRSPIRIASVVFALVAAVLLIGSLVLARLARTQPRAGEARPRR